MSTGGQLDPGLMVAEMKSFSAEVSDCDCRDRRLSVANPCAGHPGCSPVSAVRFSPISRNWLLWLAAAVKAVAGHGAVVHTVGGPTVVSRSQFASARAPPPPCVTLNRQSPTDRSGIAGVFDRFGSWFSSRV